MNYTEIDLQIEDIMWFGIDKNGYIFEATSGGCANVPDFVIRSKEDSEKLNDYFMSLPQGKYEYNLLEELNPKYPAYKECIALAKNGITCFDMDDEYTEAYKKIAGTSEPRKMDEMPKEIQQLLSSRQIEFDAIHSLRLEVIHGI